MERFAKRVERVALACVAVLAVVFASAASAELAAWDQARVTSIAQRLAAAAQGWETATREQVGGDVGMGDAPESLPGRARVLRQMSDSLAGHLGKGDGYEKTRDQYRSLREVADDTEEAAQRSPLEAPLLDAWSKVADALREIAPYYDPKADAGK